MPNSVTQHLSSRSDRNRDAYISLLKNALLNTIYEDSVVVENPVSKWKAKLLKRLYGADASLVRVEKYDADKRALGVDWPALAHTMIGVKRMDNLRSCLEDVIENSVKGDFIETGVWRGGASIFAKGILNAYGQTDRKVWLADSFEGLPRPNPRDYPADQGDEHYKYDFLRVGVEEVKSNFGKYGLLDDSVIFVKGWFKDTLPTLQISSIAVLRLDGDMYESTMDALKALYNKVSLGGYIIVDDYCIPSCAKAIADFRESHHISSQMHEIDGTGVFWKKEEANQQDQLVSP